MLAWPVRSAPPPDGATAAHSVSNEPAGRVGGGLAVQEARAAGPSPPGCRQGASGVTLGPNRESQGPSSWGLSGFGGDAAGLFCPPSGPAHLTTPLHRTLHGSAACALVSEKGGCVRPPRELRGVVAGEGRCPQTPGLGLTAERGRRRAHGFRSSRHERPAPSPQPPTSPPAPRPPAGGTAGLCAATMGTAGAPSPPCSKHPGPARPCSWGSTATSVTHTGLRGLLRGAQRASEWPRRGLRPRGYDVYAQDHRPCCPSSNWGTSDEEGGGEAARLPQSSPSPATRVLPALTRTESQDVGGGGRGGQWTSKQTKANTVVDGQPRCHDSRKPRIRGSRVGSVATHVPSTRWQHVSSGKPPATCPGSLGSRKGRRAGGFPLNPSFTEEDTEVWEGAWRPQKYALVVTQSPWPHLPPFQYTHAHTCGHMCVAGSPAAFPASPSPVRPVWSPVKKGVPVRSGGQDRVAARGGQNAHCRDKETEAEGAGTPPSPAPPPRVGESGPKPGSVPRCALWPGVRARGWARSSVGFLLSDDNASGGGGWEGAVWPQ